MAPEEDFRMDVASLATLTQTGSPKRPTSSLCNDSLYSRSARLNFIESRRVRIRLLMHLIPGETDQRLQQLDCFASIKTYSTGGLGAYGELSTHPPCSCALCRPPKLSTSSQGFEYDRLAEKQEKTPENEKRI